MTASDCTEVFDPHKLDREGTSQAQRRRKELAPDYFRVDEHQPSDWMVFAQRYAEYLHFFEINNTIAGDWQAFFNADPSAVLSVAAIQNVDFYKNTLAGYFSVLRDSSAPIDRLTESLTDAFNSLATLAWQLDRLKDRLPGDIPLKSILQNSIRSELALAFARLIAYYKALAAHVIQTGQPYPWEILGVKIERIDTLIEYPFSPDWYHQSSAESWNAFVAEIDPDFRVSGGALLSDVRDKLNYAAGYNLFTGIFDLFIKTYSRTVNEARTGLALTFSEKDNHAPHYTLFLAFLRLFEFARDHANSITAKHLDFFYKDVLRLTEKPAVPNHAHLLLQLAKHKDNHRLPAGTQFNAGKDSQGRDLIYRLADETVINAATVSELKSVEQTSSVLYALPKANSADGRGAELTSSLKQWHPFVGSHDTENVAHIGFAIASHYLRLREGRRLVNLNLTFVEPIAQQTFCKSFDFFLTGTEGWIQAKLGKSADSMTITPNTTVVVPLVIEGGAPAVVPLKTDIHGTPLPEGVPVLKAVLKQTQPDGFTPEQWLSLKVNPGLCRLDVAVGFLNMDDKHPDEAGTGLKKLHIYNKFGELKSDKPFQPFGSVPDVGDYLIIGADEVFQKRIATIQFRVVWKNLPDWRGNIDFDWVNDFAPTVSLTFLKNGRWDTAHPDLDNVEIFKSSSATVDFPPVKVALPIEAASAVHDDEQPYNQERRNGFLKVTLRDDFDHKLYQATLSRYLMRVAQKDPALTNNRGTLRDLVYDFAGGKYVPKNKYTFKEDFIEHFSKAFPNEPYTPEIDSLTLHYSASVKLPEERTAFHWIYPFGYKTAELSDPVIKLMPEWSAQAEFYIGIDALKPPQNLALLFQVVEGSVDPNVKKPDKHIEWSYLADNRWRRFNATDISDASGQLTRSGIIRFAFPKEATNTDTLFFPPGKHWLKAEVNERPNAVAKIIEVAAQAISVTLETPAETEDGVIPQLSPDSIKKLVHPEAAVKHVMQPYPAFGGRSRESSEQFHTRVSERLRHKNRAIMLWDYEHLILEAFPAIYKVKCLNHMHVEVLADGSRIYNELAPGHVTLVAVPKFDHLTAVDPLKPYTSLGELELIKHYVKKHVSCFVNLHVNNPIFEEVRVDFSVKFLPGIDATFYKERLIQEIIRFLSPWAFTDNHNLDFGGKIYKSSLINFVEERDYVDFVTDFKLFQPQPAALNDNGFAIDGPDLEEANAATALSILVSAPADRHTVRVIPDAMLAMDTEVCSC